MDQIRIRGWPSLVLFFIMLALTALSQPPTTSCSMKQFTVSLSRRILPGCVRGEQSVCDNQVEQVASSIGLVQFCGNSRIQSGSSNGNRRRLESSPTSSPSLRPSTSPLTSNPSASPDSSTPSHAPSLMQMTPRPSGSPSGTPSSSSPSRIPSVSPHTSKPSKSPSVSPTTSKPSRTPSITRGPSFGPATSLPSSAPTTSRPSRSPSRAPTNNHPSHSPSRMPTTTRPSKSPSRVPVTSKPSRMPSRSPTTAKPSKGPSRAPSLPPSKAPSKSPTTAGIRVFVSPILGNDENVGTDHANPLATIQKALVIVRGVSAHLPREIVLMSGKHRVTVPVTFGPPDSGISIRGENNNTTVTGAISLNGLSWTQESSDVFSTVVPRGILNQVEDLSVLSYNGEPMIRARYPNKNKYSEFAWAPKAGIFRWKSASPVAKVTRSIKMRVLSGVIRYGQFVSGTGGSCSGMFQPPVGYYCGGIGDADGTCRFSRVVQATLQSTYANVLQPTSWSRVDKAHFHVIHYARWGGWTFRVANVGSNVFNLAEGGYQEARGDCGLGGAEWFIDNVPELLDYQNEFYLNRDTGLLRMKLPTGARQNPNEAEMELGSSATTLFNFVGESSSNPITAIRIQNIQFERTSPAFMKPHEMPSGGDWSITRSAAVFFQNARNISVSDCTFTKLGSHGVFLSNHIRGAAIERNVFYGIDGTCVAMVGDPKYNAARPWDRTNDLDYVSGVVIRNNMMSRMGLSMYQSAGIFGSIATDVLSFRNVIFDGPRAGIVYNDLFGNNLVTRENILFNLVSVTQDHGPYNVWDRQQWLLPAGFKTRPNVVDRNLFIGSDWGDKVVDLDDGARAHQITNNVLVDGYVKFKGGASTGTNNIIVINDLPNPASCVYINNAVYKSPKFAWRNNTCYGPGSNKVVPYAWSRAQRVMGCKTSYLATSSNRFYGVNPVFGSCAKTLVKWQKVKKQDPSSTFDSLPRPVEEVAQACAILLQQFGVGS